MGNSLRCCLACVLPCGALDLVRIVHLSGQVDVHSRPVLAGEILAAYPNHVLTKPCSQVVARKTAVVSAESQLKRGNIYFLIPATSVAPSTGDRESETKRRERRTRATSPSAADGVAADQTTTTTSSSPGDSSYLAEILSEVKPTHCRRRSGRIAVWRPHLQSIHEDP